MQYDDELNELLSSYRKKRYQIKKKLKEFGDLYKSNDECIFKELCFCILTPQSKAIYCDEAVKELVRSGLLLKGEKSDIKANLRRVRFPNNKASYLIAARKAFKNSGRFDIKSKIDEGDIFKTREWFVKNIKGLGYKEASHFLRNIGFGNDIAILDIHILRSLRRYGIIKKIPSLINRKIYLNVENKMRGFSLKIGIPLQELDLLFWSEQTGFIFK
ncbi:MAG: N-glycosylase/DNA lyase [Actinobacteria bacterium]|nr:N-glycosylase/DNA lyase [Actinomycetota bacterium]